MNTSNSAAALFSDGEAYETLMGRWSRPVGERFLDWLNIPKGLRWLDVGCGNGAFTETLIGRCAPAAVTGVDPSEAQLAYARSRAGAKMAQFRIGDAQALPFDNASFDAAVMALVITFVPDPGKAVAEMARVVRPGGWVATYMWDVPADGLPISPLCTAMDYLGMPRATSSNAASSRRDAMQRFWERAGLQAVQTHVIRIPVAYSSFEDFWASNTVPVGPLGKALSEMPAGAKDALRDRLLQTVSIDLNGRIAYEAFANAVEGKVPG